MVRKKSRERREYHEGGNAQIYKMLISIRTKKEAFRLQIISSTTQWSVVDVITLGT